MDQQQQPEYQMNYNEYLNHVANQKEIEKTFVDKILDRKDYQEIEKLMKKESMSRKDWLRLMFLINGVKNKLYAFTDRERVVLGLYMAWIRQFIKDIETMMEFLTKIEENDLNLLTIIKDSSTDRNYAALCEVKNQYEHNAKFLIDIFLYLCNSSLSIETRAFNTLSTNKFEYAYPLQNQPQPQQPQGFMLGGRNRRGN